MVGTVTVWGVNPNNRAMFVPCFTFYNCGRVVLECFFFRSSNTTRGGDDWSGYYCDAGGCWDQYGGVIGNGVGNVAQEKSDRDSPRNEKELKLFNPPFLVFKM